MTSIEALWSASLSPPTARRKAAAKIRSVKVWARAFGRHRPNNTFGGIPTTATDYSPVWDATSMSGPRKPSKGLSRSPDGGVSHFELARDGYITGLVVSRTAVWAGNRLRRGSTAQLSKVGERVARRLGTAIPGRRSLVLRKVSLEHGCFFVRRLTRKFEAAAMPHLTDLHRTASFLLRDPHEAEDLVQETYLEAWKSFHRFELGTNCRACYSRSCSSSAPRTAKASQNSRVITIDAPEGQDELAAEPVVPQEIRDEDVLNALEKVAWNSANRPTRGC